MSARIVFYVILTQMMTNGYWIWFHYDIHFKDTPFPFIPIVFTIVVIASVIGWIIDNWSD